MSRKHKINQLKVKKEFREIDDLKEVNKSTIKLILEQIKTQLQEMYLFPEKVDQLCDALDTDYRKQVYNDITEPMTLVKALTRTLQNNVPDKHLQVQLPSETYGYPKKAHPFNGIEKAEILPENIGCITINSFLPLDISQNTVLGAMQFVRDTETLIIDLRKCRGGSADSANFLLSYFFKEANTLLLKTYFRPRNEDIQVWSCWTPYKYIKPVYILISNFTFSAGEHFAFAMKIHNKAILIGSNSGGGAHPVAINLLESGIALKIPIGRTYDPVSDLDWEGTGVIPDIECSEDEALEITRKEILKHQSEMSE